MSRKAFTLIELLVVVAVLALLASIVFSNLGGAREGARISNALSFQSQTHSLLGSDLVGWWNFNEGSGSVVNDISGYGNNATIVGATYVDGVPGTGGNSLKFNGSNNYAKIIDTVVSGPTSLTISAWFRKTGEGSSYECVLHQSSDTSVGASSYWLGLDSNDYLTATIGAGTGVGWSAGQTTTRSVIDTWYHLLASWDGSVVRIYIDGKYNKQYNLSSYNSLTTPTRFGASSDGTSYQYNGLIDDVRIYSRALTASEIQTLYAQTKDNYLANE